MLYTEKEIEIMSSAKQPGMRKPGISPTPFQAILDDALKNVKFDGARILDIGPGQFDFLDIAKKRGASTHGIDFDPAVCQLGELRGHKTVEKDVKKGWGYPQHSFDGIFCRGSINCYWFDPEVRLPAFLESVTTLLEKGGWLWIAPWNNPPTDDPALRSAVRTKIDSWADVHGIEVLFPDTDICKRYGIGYTVPQVEIWMKTL